MTTLNEFLADLASGSIRADLAEEIDDLDTMLTSRVRIVCPVIEPQHRGAMGELVGVREARKGHVQEDHVAGANLYRIRLDTGPGRGWAPVLRVIACQFAMAFEVKQCKRCKGCGGKTQ